MLLSNSLIINLNITEFRKNVQSADDSYGLHPAAVCSFLYYSMRTSRLRRAFTVLLEIVRGQVSNKRVSFSLYHPALVCHPALLYL